MSDTAAHDPVSAPAAVTGGDALPEGGVLGPVSPAMVSVQDLVAHH